MPPTLPSTTTAIWTRLMRATTHLQTAVEAGLAAQSLPPLAWYDALWELEKAGTEGIRPFALQERLLLPQYGLSRLIERLVKAGFVDKRACDGDARGHILHLTKSGTDVRARMWPVYAQTLSASLSDRLTEAEQHVLAQLLERLRG